jgi:cold shock CspA family protein
MSELTGKIAFYQPTKQFGFIRPDTEGPDTFFHLDNFDGEQPAIGDRVAFMVEADPRREGKRRAKTVVPIQN